MAQPHMGGATPVQVVLSCIKKVDRMSYGECTTFLHGLCFSSCLNLLLEFLP